MSVFFAVSLSGFYFDRLQIRMRSVVFLVVVYVQITMDAIDEFGRNISNQDSSNSVRDSYSTPIGSRIKVSTSRILKDVSSAVKQNAAISIMTSLPTSSDKGSLAAGAASSSSQSVLFQAQCVPDLFTPSRSELTHTLSPEIFRSQHLRSDDKAESDFEAFMSNSYKYQSSAAMDPGIPSTPSYYKLPLQKEKNSNSYATLNPGTDFDWNVTRNDTHPDRDIDGAAVVMLLSSPDFFLQQEPDVDMFAETTELDRVYDKPKRTDFWAEARPPLVTHSNPLNLLPDFQNAREPAAPYPTRPDQSWENSESTNPSVNAASEYGKLHAWIEILDSYQDQVWGDLLPLVQEARSEIRVNKEVPTEARRDTPATRRLAMILKHIDHLAKH